MSTALYDADCGFCTASARWLARSGSTARFVALQSVDLAALGVDAARSARELPVLTADGRVVYGASAIAELLREGPRWHRVLAVVLNLPLVAPLAGIAYRWVAAHRHQLPGGTPTCRLPAS